MIVKNLGFIRKTDRTTLHLRQSFWNISLRLQLTYDYNLKFSNVPESLNSDKICIRFRIDPLSRAFSNQCVFDENARRISVDRKADTHRNVRAFKRKRMSVWTGPAGMRLNCLFPESFKLRVLNSRVFFQSRPRYILPWISYVLSVSGGVSVIARCHNHQSES